MKYYICKDHVFLDYIESTGPGSGTSGMRFLVKLSMNEGLGGNIKLDASYSSHVFHLFMGMIPVPKQYYSDVYGMVGECALEVLKSGNEKDSIESRYLKMILSNEKDIPENQITDQMILENKNFLLSLEKKTSLMGFAAQLLNILENNIGNKRPNTTSLYGVCMVLSEEGKARWKKAIENNEPFEPFRDYAHLRPYMSMDQITRLDRILSEHQFALAAKESLSQSQTKTSSGGIFAHNVKPEEMAPNSKRELDDTNHLAADVQIYHSIL